MDYEQLEQLAKDLDERVAQLEELLDNFSGERIEKKKFTANSDFKSEGTLEHTGDKAGFFGVDPVDRPGAVSDLSQSTVSGTGDDSTINSNFTDIYDTLGSIRSALIELGFIQTP